jgi:hypothetical protein
VEAAAERPSFSDERLSSATDSGHDLCFFVCLFSCREREREREREVLSLGSLGSVFMQIEVGAG